MPIKPTIKQVSISMTKQEKEILKKVILQLKKQEPTKYADLKPNNRDIKKLCLKAQGIK